MICVYTWESISHFIPLVMDGYGKSLAPQTFRCKKKPKFSAELGPKSRRNAGNCSS